MGVDSVDENDSKDSEDDPTTKKRIRKNFKHYLPREKTLW